MIRTYAATFAGDARMTSAVARLVELLGDTHLDARIRAAQSLLVLSQTHLKSTHKLQSIRPDRATGCSVAVRVQNAELVHTTQLLPVDSVGQSVSEQLESVLQQLDQLLNEFAAGRQDLVKLNVYLQDSTDRRLFFNQFSKWCEGQGSPSVTSVATPLPGGARIAIDAVFAGRKSDGGFRPATAGLPATGVRSSIRNRARSLPPGDVVYVSGQAAVGDLVSATRDTLRDLFRTLEYMKLSRGHIVQLKCFLAPMQRVDEVDQQIATAFAPGHVPPVSHVEWQSGSRPIEIEIVAWAPHQKSSDSVTYVTPPWMKSSAVFSRVARVHGNDRLYVSELTVSTAGESAATVRSLFQQMRQIVIQGGSDMRHLAKATYYVSSDQASRQLNEVRPAIFDPQRPPAASKAMVREVGTPGRSMSIDMIAGVLREKSRSGGRQQ
ncbi:MAG: RidA family protein [Planctomycetaceae bacterium]